MKKILIKTFLSLLVLVLAAATAYWLYQNKPQTRKKKPRRPIPVVKTITVESRDEQVVFEASGTVIPARKVPLLTEVEGRVISQNPELVPGGLVAKDDLLIQIDPLDYQLRVRDRQADVATARYELEVEQGKQIIARQEWQILENEIQEEQASKNLALRTPHRQHKEAQLEAAASRLASAELAEQRTAVRAPFAALVLDENVEVGQFVRKQSPIATLVATDEFWIRVSVPLSLLDRIRFPEKNGDKGSSAQIILEKGYGKSPALREAAAFKLLGDLEPMGRMARIVFTVQDPFNLKAEKTVGSPRINQGDKILLGSFVKVRIDAGVMKNVTAIPRQGLREGDRVWTVNNEGTVNFRDVKVVWRRIDEVLAELSLPAGERIILSRLQSPVAGMYVRDQSRLKSRGGKQKKGMTQ